MKTTLICFIFRLLLLLLPSSLLYASPWLKVDLQYPQTIDGKKYLAQVSLLRPESYFIHNYATTAGTKLRVDLPEMGLDKVAMDVVRVVPFQGVEVNESGIETYKQIDEINLAGRTDSPVTGTFDRYAKVVNSYHFKNLKTGKTTTLNVTPNHRFYVKNRNKFIAIDEVSSNDQLLTDDGSIVKLLCKKNQYSQCGSRYNTDGKPMRVYNLEVYGKHMYFAGNDFNILVHNVYNCVTCDIEFRYKYALKNHELTHRAPRTYVCTEPGCNKAYKTRNILRRHKLSIHDKLYKYSCEQCEFKTLNKTIYNVHLRKHAGETPFGCPYCNYKTNMSSNLQRHIKNIWHKDQDFEGLMIVNPAEEAGPSTRPDLDAELGTELDAGFSKFLNSLVPELAPEFIDVVFGLETIPPSSASNLEAELDQVIAGLDSDVAAELWDSR